MKTTSKAGLDILWSEIKKSIFIRNGQVYKLTNFKTKVYGWRRNKKQHFHRNKDNLSLEKGRPKCQKYK